MPERTLLVSGMSLAEFLATHVGAVDARSIERVGHGEWSRAFYFATIDGRELVARFSATEQDFRKDQLVQRWSSTRLPMPALVQLGHTPEGEYFAISERAHGEFLEVRDAAAMTRLLPSLWATLDTARGIDLSHTTGYGLFGADGHAPHANWRAMLLDVVNDPPSTRTHGWRARLAARPVAQRVFDAGYARLLTLLDACPEGRHLVHSDLLNFNVLTTGDRVTAVFDWGAALYGDFLWDVAWLTFWQPWYPRWADVDLRAGVREHYRQIGLPLPNFDARLRCYELAIGLDGLAYQAWANKHPDDVAWTTRRVEGLLTAQL